MNNFYENFSDTMYSLINREGGELYFAGYIIFIILPVGCLLIYIPIQLCYLGIWEVLLIFPLLFYYKIYKEYKKINNNEK